MIFSPRDCVILLKKRYNDCYGKLMRFDQFSVRRCLCSIMEGVSSVRTVTVGKSKDTGGS